MRERLFSDEFRRTIVEETNLIYAANEAEIFVPFNAVSSSAS